MILCETLLLKYKDTKGDVKGVSKNSFYINMQLQLSKVNDEYAYISYGCVADEADVKSLDEDKMKK